MPDLTTAMRDDVANVLSEFLLGDDLDMTTTRVLAVVERYAVADVEHNGLTGSCMCTSFRWNTWDGKCEECSHESHASRIHCGALK